MPVLLPIAAWAAAATAAAISATGITSLAFAQIVYAVSYATITAVASGVVSYGTQALLGGGSKPSAHGGQTVSSQDSAAGFRYVVGRCRVYGVRVWPTAYPVTFKHRNSDEKNHAYGQFQILSAKPLTSIDIIFSDDVQLNLIPETRSGLGLDFWAVDQKPFNKPISVGNSYFYVNYGLGDSDPGPRDELLGFYSDLVDNPDFWPVDATPDGVAWLSSVAMEALEPLTFPNGPPRLSAEVTGIAIYDPRDPAQDPDDESTWEWSDNSALIAAWYVTREFGFSASYSDIDMPSLIVAANDCDELVDTFESTGATDSPPTEKKYRCWGEIVEGDDRDGTLAGICATMAGGWAEVGGKWYFFAGVYHAPATTITDEWIFGEVSYVAQGEISEAINTLAGTFLSPTNRWQQIPYPSVSNAEALAEVGGNVVEDTLNLVLVPTHTQAQRIALIEIKRRRRGRAITLPVHLGYGLLVRPGEIVNVNLPQYKIDNRPARVEGWNLSVEPVQGDMDDRSGGQLMVELQLRFEDEDGYTVEIEEMTDLPASPQFEDPDGEGGWTGGGNPGGGGSGGGDLD